METYSTKKRLEVHKKYLILSLEKCTINFMERHSLNCKHYASYATCNFVFLFDAPYIRINTVKLFLQNWMTLHFLTKSNQFLGLLRYATAFHYALFNISHCNFLFINFLIVTSGAFRTL